MSETNFTNDPHDYIGFSHCLKCARFAYDSLSAHVAGLQREIAMLRARERDLVEACEDLAQSVINYLPRFSGGYCHGCRVKEGFPHLVECTFRQAEDVLKPALSREGGQ